MAKRMTVNEIERFIDKLQSTERINGYTQSQKINAIACLNNLCRDLQYNGYKSMKINDEISKKEIFNE